MAVLAQLNILATHTVMSATHTNMLATHTNMPATHTNMPGNTYKRQNSFFEKSISVK